MQHAQQKVMNVLIMGRLDTGSDLDQWVHDHTKVHHADSVDAAIDALREEAYDIVISSAPEFIPFKELHFSKQAGAILDSVNKGVGIVDKDGEFVWANPKLLDYPADIRNRVSHFCLETFNLANERMNDGGSHVRGRRFSIRTVDNKRYEITATPVIDLHNRVQQVAAVVWDATTAMRLQEKFDAIDQAGRELVRLDAEQFSRLNMQQRLNLLEQKILRCTNDILHFDNFAIFVVNDRTKKLDLVFCSGMPEQTQKIELLVETEGHGICGYVAARGRSYICHDVSKDPRYISGIEGARASLTVPLRLHDRIIGVANFESTRVGAFTEDERQFAEIFGRYVAIALHILELLGHERYTTTGRLGSDVLAEITAPVNDILTDIETLTEDYIGHDDLRHRLRTISGNAVRIRDIIKEMTAAKPGVIGNRTLNSVRSDPLLTGKRILIVDDEDVIRDTVRDVLSGYGCDVTSVSDGGSAVDLVCEQPCYDLVISDIKMPVKNGYEVFAAAKDRDPDTPVILMTGFGYDPNHSIVRARREGLNAVLFKPFKVDQLLSEIRMALKSSAGA